MSIFKSATETSFIGNYEGGTGKPRKLETQTKVGALWFGKWTDEETYLYVDKWLPPVRVQNMAYMVLI